MANVFVEKSTGEKHVTFYDKTLAADVKAGDIVKFGNLVANYDLDYKSGSNLMISVTIGGIWQVAVTDVTGTPTVTAALYLTADGALTTSATETVGQTTVDNTEAGTVVFVDASVIKFLAKNY